MKIIFHVSAKSAIEYEHIHEFPEIFRPLFTCGVTVSLGDSVWVLGAEITVVEPLVSSAHTVPRS